MCNKVDMYNNNYPLIRIGFKTRLRKGNYMNMWHINRKPKKTKNLQVRKQPGSTKTLKGSWFHTGNVVVLQKSDLKKIKYMSNYHRCDGEKKNVKINTCLK